MRLLKAKQGWERTNTRRTKVTAMTYLSQRKRKLLRMTPKLVIRQITQINKADSSNKQKKKAQ
eukprot:7092874-Heterocapsa_arctica.AAC.1